MIQNAEDGHLSTLMIIYWQKIIIHITYFSFLKITEIESYNPTISK